MFFSVRALEKQTKTTVIQPVRTLIMRNILKTHYYYFSDYHNSEIKFKMIYTTVLAMLTSLTCTMADMKWRNVTVLNIEESNVMQLHCDVVVVARSLLNETTMGTHHLHPKAHPALLDHAGWSRSRDLLRLALTNFEMAIRLPGRSNCSIAKPRSKRSFLGLSTVADNAHLEERIQVLQAAEDRAAKMTNFLSSKLQKGAALMSSYIRGRVEEEGDVQESDPSPDGSRCVVDAPHS